MFFNFLFKFFLILHTNSHFPSSPSPALSSFPVPAHPPPVHSSEEVRAHLGSQKRLVYQVEAENAIGFIK